MSYKNITAILILIFLVLPSLLFGQQQQENGYEISGQINGLEEGERIVMALQKVSGLDSTATDIGFVKNGKFTIKGIVPEGPRKYYMFFDKHPKAIMILFIDNGEQISIKNGGLTEVNGWLENRVEIERSPTMSAYFQMYSIYQFYQQNLFALSNYANKLRDSIGFSGPIFNTIFLLKDQLTKTFYNAVFLKPARNIIPARLWCVKGFSNISGHSPRLIEAYNKLDDKEKNSYYGKVLEDCATLAVSQPFPLFSLPTIDGKKFNLKDVLSKGQATIIHFWGSENYKNAVSAGDVKIYHKDMKAMYQKYGSKGLNIVAIAAEDSSTLYSFNKLLKEQQFPWPNVTDLKGHLNGSIINDIYKEGGHSIPNVTNYLLDRNGKIIAYDPKGVELQWYLWKIFGE